MIVRGQDPLWGCPRRNEASPLLGPAVSLRQNTAGMQTPRIRSQQREVCGNWIGGMQSPTCIICGAEGDPQPGVHHWTLDTRDIRAVPFAWRLFLSGCPAVTAAGDGCLGIK